MSAPLVQIENVHKSFGSTTALAAVDLTVQAGTCVTLLGPNGAGKTTLLNLIEGFEPADSGSVKVLSLDPQANFREISQSIGVLLQETNLYKRYTVKETFELFASFYKNSMNVDEIIQRMNLAEKSNEYLKNLSGGQRQRVNIGLCLINSPKLILLDEPTTGLDPQARRAIWDVCKEIKEAGCGILLTTHYMEEAEQLSDYLYILDAGTVIAKGSPRDLLAGKETSYSIELNLESDQLVTLATEMCQKEDWLPAPDKPGTWKIPIPRSLTLGDAIQKFSQACKKVDLAHDGIQIKTRNLEALFIELTGRNLRD